PAPAEEIDLAGQWLFQRDEEDIGLAQDWASPEFDDSAWEAIEVPADWGEFDGLGWYRHRIDLPAELEGRRLYLVFDGVDDESWLYVDGELRAECHTWNRRHWADLSDLAGETVSLAVRVNDHGMGGGIHAPVRLVLTAERTELLEGPWHREPALAPPDWLPGSVIYEVFVRDFSETGDFEGLRQRLPELAELGVDVVWLMPIHPLGELDRKGTMGSPYAIRDHMAINPDFGTEEDLHRLVEDVHALGMRIIIDAVLNHSSPDGVLVEDHIDWYEIVDEDGRPHAENEDWWDIADFDWSNREVWDYFNEMMTYWVREFDIDGYRCDVASLMPTEFWEQLLPQLQAIKPDVMMLAESDAPELHRASFHISYNWTLWDAMVPVLNGEMPASHLADAMEQDIMTFQRGALRMPFAENHDKERAINEFGGVDRARLAALIALTVAECPLIYNGQEAGCSEPRDIFEQIPLDWSDPHGFRPYFEQLIALRRESPALRLGQFERVETEFPDQIFAFRRNWEYQGPSETSDTAKRILAFPPTAAQSALVIANVSSEEIRLPLDSLFDTSYSRSIGLSAGAIQEIFGGLLGVCRIEEDEIVVPPHSGDVHIPLRDLILG
ncbi:hypothetical protein JXA47_03050, partial [Candidatus Sumerlaeota bacterium]|nr:hypothetical protein [Candidatus Sumerlaeota bacterium]